MSDTFNNQVFVVEDTVRDNQHLVIKDSLLDDYETFSCIGQLELAEERVTSSWGYDIDEDSRLGLALKSSGLDPDDYRSRALDDRVGDRCIERVRELLGVSNNPSVNTDFNFK